MRRKKPEAWIVRRSPVRVAGIERQHVDALSGAVPPRRDRAGVEEGRPERGHLEMNPGVMATGREQRDEIAAQHGADDEATACRSRPHLHDTDRRRLAGSERALT